MKNKSLKVIPQTFFIKKLLKAKIKESSRNDKKEYPIFFVLLTANTKTTIENIYFNKNSFF